MTTWKPGDVAMIPFGRGDTVAIYTERSGWVTADNHASSRSYSGIRPLVVVDPESADDIDRLCDLIAEDVDWLALQAALREFAAPTPPKPDEPTGLGAVVEDDKGERWVRWEIVDRHTRPWSVAGAIKPNRAYHQIDVVRVLSEGVQ